MVGVKSVALLFATNFNTVGMATAASDLNLAYIAAGVESVALLIASKTLILEHSGWDLKSTALLIATNFNSFGVQR